MDIALAKEQLANCEKELASLKIPGYQGEKVVDGVVDGKEFTSTEWETADAYTKPRRAVALMIECAQLRLEILGLPRRKIMTAEEARKLQFKRDKGERRANIHMELLAKPKTPLVVVRGSVESPDDPFVEREIKMF